MYLFEMLDDNTAKLESSNDTSKPFKLWIPKQVVFTADAINEPTARKYTTILWQ